MTQCSELQPRLILPPPPPLLCTKLSDLVQVTTLAFIFLICEMGLIMPAFPISYRNGQSEITLKKQHKKLTEKFLFSRAENQVEVITDHLWCTRRCSYWVPSPGSGGKASLQKTLSRLVSSWCLLGRYSESPGLRGFSWLCLGLPLWLLLRMLLSKSLMGLQKLLSKEQKGIFSSPGLAWSSWNRT